MTFKIECLIRFKRRLAIRCRSPPFFDSLISNQN